MISYIEKGDKKMYNIYSNRGQIAYGITEFTVDTEADVKTLPINCTPGSTAFVIETSKYYKLNNSRQWKEVKLSKGTGGGSSDEEYDGGEPSINDPTPAPDEDYDGGEPSLGGNTGGTSGEDYNGGENTNPDDTQDGGEA